MASAIEQSSLTRIYCCKLINCFGNEKSKSMQKYYFNVNLQTIFANQFSVQLNYGLQIDCFLFSIIFVKHNSVFAKI